VRRVPGRALLRSEWTKLRSTPAVWVAVAVYAAVVVVGAWLSLSGTRAPDDVRVAVGRALVGFAPAQLALLVVGALAVTGEYRTGTVLASLTAVPGRTRWLIAKTLVVVFWVAVLTAVLAAGCVAAVPALTAGANEILLTDPVVLEPIGLQVASAVLVTVLGLALGALLRRTVAVAVVGTALVAVLPVVAVLTGNATARATAWLWPTLRVGADDVLTVADRGEFGIRSGGDVLLAGATTWPAGVAVIGGWALVLWVIGAVVTERRDA
jgi:ABC-2 type transport system permease protein